MRSATRFKFIFLFSLVAICCSTVAEAYIPRAQTIAARLARTHGKGAYTIEQDVQFRIGAETLVLRERWTVEGSDSMRLSVSLPPAGGKSTETVHFEALYQDGKRTWTDPSSGEVKTTSLGAEFIEPFFHSRSGRSFLNTLVRSKIVPASFLNERPRPQKAEQIRHLPESHVRLGRTSGIVAWVFGEPSPANGALNPSVWIEQDLFLLRRLRFPSEAELFADKYSTYAKDLTLPRERTLNWQGGSASVRVVSVRALGASARSMRAAMRAGRLPDHAQIREFYTRFR